ncbi:MAG TPA: phosphoribosyl transferase [Clostridiales bacterium UBA8153]|nr:phosphoribosyl transferase [Clostridiales bacterium UBA8153]
MAVALLRDRQEAGEKLAERCAGYRGSRPLVLAVPRGGVVVGAVLAHALGGELDVVVARKIGAPHHPEFAIGSVTESGAVLLEAGPGMTISPDFIGREAAAQRREIARRTRYYRQGRPRPGAGGRVTLVVDDGIATGLTIRAALQSIAHEKPARLVLAVPVAPPEVLPELAPYADELICLHTPDPFCAVGQWYRDFEQTSDGEVMALLQKARGFPMPGGG